MSEQKAGVEERSTQARLQGVKRDLTSWALKYEKFREELLADPKAVVEKELGAGLPAGMEVRVVEESEKTLFLVIPRNPCEDQQGVDLRQVARWGSGSPRLPVSEGAGKTADPGARLIARAWQDAVFRRTLLADPEAAVREELGVDVLAGVELKVVEESAERLYIVLPANIDEAHETLGEFAEEELGTLAASMVAGSPGGVGSTFAC